jgi:hypothetical protein
MSVALTSPPGPAPILSVRVGPPLLEQSRYWNWKVHVVTCSVGLIEHLYEGLRKYTLIVKPTSNVY